MQVLVSMIHGAPPAYAQQLSMTARASTAVVRNLVCLRCMRTLYIANKNYSSWSLRPWLLLKQLGIPFDEQMRPFPNATNGAAPYRTFSPSGRVPCLHDGEIVVWDSLAIVEYLAEAFPQVWPADRAARAWARSACAEMHAGFAALRSNCSMNCGVRVQLREIGAALAADLDRLSALWSDGLSRWRGPFLAGATFTAVDAFYAPVAFRIQTYQLPLPDVALAYAARLRELPAMQQWYRDGLAETARDTAHDREMASVGEVLQDLRAQAGL